MGTTFANAEQALTATSVIMTVIVAGRFVMRWYRSVGYGLDDWLILAAVAFTWATYVVQMHGMLPYIRAGLTTLSAVTSLSMYTFVDGYVYTTALALTKVSILCTYVRIFPTVFMRRACLVVGVVSLAWWLAGILLSTFECRPIAKTWDSSLEGTCLTGVGFAVGPVVPNIVTDLAMLSLPAHEIFKLRASLARRLGLLLVFALGLAVPVASSLRLAVLYYMETDTSADPNVTVPAFCIWTHLEVTLGPMAISLPVLAPLVPWTFQRLGLSKSNNSSAGRKGSSNKIVTIGGSGPYMSRKHREPLGSRDGTSPPAYEEGDSDSVKRLYGAVVEVGPHSSEASLARDRAGDIPLKTISVRTDIRVRQGDGLE